jgi:hypothetical protein
MPDLFLGEPVAYWVELKASAEKLNATELLKSNALLRAKVSYYEDAIHKMIVFKDRVDGESS